MIAMSNLVHLFVIVYGRDFHTTDALFITLEHQSISEYS